MPFAIPGLVPHDPESAVIPVVQRGYEYNIRLRHISFFAPKGEDSGGRTSVE